jgi:polyhydroxyalkanoate synthesis regulator protein
MKPTRVITLYANRKYYDKSLRGHVTLLDIIQAVKDGDEFVVVDKDKKDITRKTISAAIYKHLVLPLDTANQLVKDFYEITLPKENTYERL